MHYYHNRGAALFKKPEASENEKIHPYLLVSTLGSCRYKTACIGLIYCEGRELRTSLLVIIKYCTYPEIAFRESS